MTFYNNFQNINMSYLSNGLNNAFTSWFTPSFGGFQSFNWNFNWGMPSLFDFSNFSFDFSKMFRWDSSLWNNSFTTFNNNNNFNWNNNFYNSYNTDIFTRTTTPSSTPTIKYNASYLKLDGYNEDFGKKLATTALEYTNYKCDKGNKTIIRTQKKSSYNWDGLCATYVKMAIRDSGGGNYENGHAYQMTDILRKNKKFKQISTNVDLKSLPAGCILVYGKGVAGYSSEYGHVEITLGDGRAASDALTTNLHKKPTAIFIPTYA